MTQAISDEMLTAYLDGALDADDRATVEAALARDPAVANRLAALDVPMAALRDGFDDLLAQAPSPPALPSVSTQPPRRWLELAAAVVIGVGLGAGALFWQGDAAPSDWKMAVADYQVLYVPQTLAMPAPEPDAAQAQLEQASAAVGVDLTPAVNAGDLSFRRAQLLGYKGRPLVQVAYLSRDDLPFALCVTDVDGPDIAPEAVMLSGLAGAFWVRDGKGFLIIGGDDLATVETLADDLQARL